MPKRHKIELGPIGPDIDLDEEEVYLPDGTRLTEDAAEELGKQMVAAARRRQGRPPLTNEEMRTPSLTVRVPSSVRTALEEIAHSQGRRLADVSRDALTEYVTKHARAGSAQKRGARRRSAS